jgi:hypothetical protein
MSHWRGVVADAPLADLAPGKKRLAWLGAKRRVLLRLTGGEASTAG